jgi:hypothetical protein
MDTSAICTRCEYWMTIHLPTKEAMAQKESMSLFFNQLWVTNRRKQASLRASIHESTVSAGFV